MNEKSDEIAAVRDLRDYLAARLKDDGYGGLCRCGCGCSLDDLIACDALGNDCVPGYAYKPTSRSDCEDNCDAYGECDGYPDVRSCVTHGKSELSGGRIITTNVYAALTEANETIERLRRPSISELLKMPPADNGLMAALDEFGPERASHVELYRAVKRLQADAQAQRERAEKAERFIRDIGYRNEFEEWKREPETHICPCCNGAGETAPWDADVSTTCRECNGSGEVPAHPAQEQAGEPDTSGGTNVTL